MLQWTAPTGASHSGPLPTPPPFLIMQSLIPPRNITQQLIMTQPVMQHGHKPIDHFPAPLGCSNARAYSSNENTSCARLDQRQQKVSDAVGEIQQWAHQVTCPSMLMDAACPEDSSSEAASSVQSRIASKHIGQAANTHEPKCTNRTLGLLHQHSFTKRTLGLLHKQNFTNRTLGLLHKQKSQQQQQHQQLTRYHLPQSLWGGLQLPLAE